ncbi:MAG: type II secretion system protein [Clostridia bacterium]|nr:type II secretion system protein [Clostridia bacterium]
MKKMNKKGFTIVELSIVIAVVAILSAVLIPTFTGIVKKAQSSARSQLATSTYRAALGVSDYGTYDNGTDAKDAWIVIEDKGTSYYFAVEGGKIEDETTTAPTDLSTAYQQVDLGETIDGATFYETK